MSEKPDKPDSTSRLTSTHAMAHALLDLGFLPHGESTDESTVSMQEAGDFIGRYRLVAVLGEGGFGLVWQAEQTEPIRRELALKVIKPGLDSREIIARFEAERQALALMDHPNIAAVLDAGTTADGRPYFAMELVKGEPITAYCDRHSLKIEERLALFIPVCRAVQHAHQKAVLHRDLKPSNILVATVDSQPVPKVIDFGIAKALVGNEGEALINMAQTQAGLVIGTPRYMSPEQAGSRPDVDTRSDVYALGVILCELLTGQWPYPAQPTGFLDALRWIREAEAVKPSTLVQASTPAAEEAAQRRGLDTRQLARRLRGDLDWVTLKALEKDRARRYDTATALARDLERHLATETVSAVAPTWRYQFGKFAQRRRGPLIAAGLVVAALIAGTVVSLWQASEAVKSRREAEHRYEQARQAVNQYLVRVTENPKLNQANFTGLQRELLETAMPYYEDLSRYRGNDPKLLTDRAWALAILADLVRIMGQLDKAEAMTRQAIAEYAALAARFPREPERLMHLSFQHHRLAMLLIVREKLDEALTEHDRAVETMEAAVALSPRNTQYEQYLVGMLNDRAFLYVKLDREQDIAETARRVVEIGNKFASQHPTPAESEFVFTVISSIQADLLHRQHRYGDEVALIRKALDHFANSANERTDPRGFREVLAINRGRLGIALKDDNQLPAAELALRQAVAELQTLADEFPTNPNFREDLVTYLKSLNDVVLIQKKTAESPPLVERIRANRERLTLDFPDITHFGRDLQQMNLELGAAAKVGAPLPTGPRVKASFGTAVSPAGNTVKPAAEASAEIYAEAIQQAGQAATHNDPEWEGLETAAETMASAVSLIQADARLDVATRDKQAEDCALRAVDFLRRAVEKDYKGMAYFNFRPFARPLQSRPDYQALLAAPVTPPAYSPQKFTFDYSYDDPGLRHWVRDGVTWTETQPSGLTHVYTIGGPMTLEGVRGSKLNRMSAGSQAVFIPDLGATDMPKLMMRKPDGSWVSLGPITSME